MKGRFVGECVKTVDICVLRKTFVVQVNKIRIVIVKIYILTSFHVYLTEDATSSRVLKSLKS